MKARIARVEEHVRLENEHDLQGVFHKPDTRPGRILTVLTHPMTMIRAIARMARRGTT